jgi:hypothetical protein
MQKIEIKVKRAFPSGAFIISAWNEDYLGEETFYGYTESEARNLALAHIAKNGGLGIWAKGKV